MSSWSIAGIMACKKINQLLNYDAREVLDWMKVTTLLNRTSSMTSSFSSTELVIRRCEPSKQVPDGNSKKRYGQSIYRSGKYRNYKARICTEHLLCIIEMTRVS